MPRSEKPKPASPSPYVSPRELATRWQCSRSSVDRVARRAGLTRLCLGEGKNGLVRYLRSEVEAHEATRRIRLAPASGEGSYR